MNVISFPHRNPDVAGLALLIPTQYFVNLLLKATAISLVDERFEMIFRFLKVTYVQKRLVKPNN